MLYDLDLPDPRMGELLELLMRRCEGIFSFAVQIDEDYFSKSVGLTVPSFRQLLYKMSLEHIINYVPQDHSDENQCRSRFLLAYFGQEESEDCGKCDICRG